MKYPILITLIVAGIITGFSLKKTPPSMPAGGFEPVAVLELFTSQGCSSCPSADKLLAKTISDAGNKGKKIFALSFHVDYWNRLGWADPFSSREFSQRQSAYVDAMHLNSAYTPQMVVNGRYEFTGSDKLSLADYLNRALQTKTEAEFTALSATLNSQKTVKVQYTAEGNIPATKINFALVSLTETTVIKRGENEGLTLKNENVVRQWVSVSKPSGEIEFSLPPGLARENTAVIAYVQKNDLTVIGAGMAKIQ